MVGVPGKYKGCETCRRRRVKCSNERPHCKKCVNSGRECEGYERERVFITGTLETKGRVASHPKKSSIASSRRDEKQWRRSSSRSEASSSPNVQPSAPFTSAWDDSTSLSDHGQEYFSTMMALHTKLDSVGRKHSRPIYEGEGEGAFELSLPLYELQDMNPTQEPKEFNCEAQFLTNFAVGADNAHAPMDSYHVFLYEHNSGAAAPWDLHDSTEMNLIRDLGPEHFQTFPHHHFFARVFRPTALCLSLLGRQDTFLAMTEWTTKPWELHPKSPMDHLVDTALFLPSLFARADEIILEPPTVERRNQAQELLLNCLTVERQFDQWLVGAMPGTVSHPVNYWPQDPCPSSMLPFPYAWAFKDGTAGTMFLYYWMTQILFHRCISTVHAAVFEPVMDAYPDVWPPHLAPALQHLDVSRYQQTRELAANICRGLDSALAVSCQPDLLLGPVQVARDLYREIHAVSQDAMLEVLWLEGFGERVRARGQDVSNTLQGQQWLELGRLG